MRRCGITQQAEKPGKELHIKYVRLDAPIAGHEATAKLIRKRKQINEKHQTVKCDKFSELFSVKTSVLRIIFYVIKHIFSVVIGISLVQGVRGYLTG